MADRHALMTRKPFRLILCLLLVALVAFLLVLFLPRSYDVPQFHARAGTQYWDLPTGSRIGYTLLPGKGDKKPYPVIFLQGGPGGFITDRNIDILTPLSEDGYNVYLYDQVGSGHSGRLQDIREYTADRHRQDLDAIVKAIGAEKVILLGQSWGAMLGVLFTATDPGRVHKLIFTGPGPIPPVRSGLAHLPAPDSLHLNEPVYTNRQANEKVRSLRSRFVLWWAVTFGRRLASDKESNDFQTTLVQELTKATVCDTSKAPDAEGGSGFYVHNMTVRSLDKVNDPRPALKGNTIPTLIMKGQCDNQKWGYTNEYLALFPLHRLVVVPGAGHSISIEQPEEYLRVIRSFLAE